MKYDFVSIIDRKGKDAMALDCLGESWAPAPPKDGYDVIPMWVADMNFPVLPDICQAIVGRINHPFFGYFEPRPEYYDAIIDWHKKRKNETSYNCSRNFLFTYNLMFFHIKPPFTKIFYVL